MKLTLNKLQAEKLLNENVKIASSPCEFGITEEAKSTGGFSIDQVTKLVKMAQGYLRQSAPAPIAAIKAVREEGSAMGVYVGLSEAKNFVEAIRGNY